MSDRVKILTDRLPRDVREWLLEKVGVPKYDRRPYVFLMLDSGIDEELKRKMKERKK